jgi:histidinol-phosphate aminotransferase
MEPNEALLLVNKHVRGLSAYHLEPVETRIKLNQNENPNDWPAEIKEELAAFCKERPWNRYPGFVPGELKRRLGEYIGHDPEGIIVGNGSNEMLQAVMISFLSPTTPAVLCPPTFTLYQLLARGLGSHVFEVPLLPDLAFDVDGLVAETVRRPGSLLLLCSPNNPTGNALDEKQAFRILESHRGILVLDQAYVEFGGFSAVPLLAAHPNLLITRTFSKAMAGAGLRLGYLLGNPAIVREINKIKLPYNVNFFVERAAEVLLSHGGIAMRRVAEIKEQRDRLYSFLKKLPLENVYPSCANFILIRSKRKSDLFSFLIKKGILVRDVSGYRMLENCLRISVGTREENDDLQKAMEAFFSGS